MAASTLRIYTHAALLCVLAAAATVLQPCVAGEVRQGASPKPRPPKRPHKAPVRPPTRRGTPRKPVARHKPAVKPAAPLARKAAASQLTTVEQVTIRRCGTPAVSQARRVALQSVLRPRMDQRAQGRAAPIAVRVFFHIVQASQRVPALLCGWDPHELACCLAPQTCSMICHSSQ